MFLHSKDFISCQSWIDLFRGFITPSWALLNDCMTRTFTTPFISEKLWEFGWIRREWNFVGSLTKDLLIITLPVKLPNDGKHSASLIIPHCEELTNHSEKVRMVNRAVPVFAPIQVGPVKDSGHHEAKVGSKRMDGHGASSISGLKPYQAAAVFQSSVFCTQII